jgi:hypothetical protein
LLAVKGGFDMKKNYGINVGDYCRRKSTPEYGWAKVIEIGYFGKTYKIAKCEWGIDKDSPILIKYFKLSDLIKEDAKCG